MKSERPIAATEVVDPPAKAPDSPPSVSAHTSSTASTTARTAPNRSGPLRRSEMTALVRLRVLVRRVQQHDDEEEQHHDRAGVDDDLNDRDERRVEQDVQTGERAERGDEQQHAVDRIALRDDEQRRHDRDRREHVEQASCQRPKYSTAAAVASRLTTASGSSTFQPNAISWS